MRVRIQTLTKRGALNVVYKFYFPVKYAVAQLVEVLPYKTEGRGFGSCWDH